MSTPAHKLSVQDEVTPAEWEVRTQLAAAYRLCVRYGWTDLIFTHLAARVPGAPDQYLINPYGLLFEEITASNLIKVDFDGNVVLGDYPVNHAGHAIHTSVFRNRADLNFSLHTHTRAGIAVSTMQCGLLPLCQQANQIMGNIAYHGYGLSVATEEECARIGRDLADKHAMILLNHGLLVCGSNIPEAFLLLYNLELACKVQIDALASGQALHEPKPDDQASLARYGRLTDESGPQDLMAWAAMIRSLDANDPSYKT